MSTESLYAAVNEVLKKLVAEAIAAEKCMKIVHRTTKKKIAPDKMEEILKTAKDELQESVLNGVSQVIHNDETCDLQYMLSSHCFMCMLIKRLSGSEANKEARWRPSGIPSDDITGHLQPVMFDIEENLIRLRCKLESEIQANKAQAMMREATLSNHIVRSLP
ncbi:unnamed protein product [Acanthocheilonema viteae]|uniref:Uncharacterized protein n=1 Tax=Acanthocheilonema viteae TaxID=6277 RepID=A0A498S026_ACAVI|nr:unnamed protein product [Acanthocheilonema viteae]